MENYTTAHELAHISQFRNDIRELAIDAAYTCLEQPVAEGNTGQGKFKSFCGNYINNPDARLEAICYGVARNFATPDSYVKASAGPFVKEVMQRLAGLSNEEITGL